MYLSRFFLLAIVLVFSVQVLFAQNVPLQALQQKEPFRQQRSILPVNTVRDENMPFYKSRFVQAAVFTGVTTGLIFFADGEIDEEYGIEQHRMPLGIPQALAGIGDVYDRAGTGFFFVGLTASLISSGLVLQDRKLLKTSELLVKSFITTLIVAGGGKMVFGRERPFVNSGARKFNFLKFSGHEQFRSLPSGHTSSVFAMMTVLAKQYPTPWVKIPAYTFAASVAMQRIDSRYHWTSDVLVGGTLGYLVGSYFVGRQHKNNKGPSVLPAIAPNRIGFRLAF